MVQFTYLKLIGFKSFAESQDVTIVSGLTGVVGPNGCGKSNIVEAMRWLMGESSARAVRGDEIDDIIFAGTATRPPRNFAEVTLHINNSSGEIAAYADAPILEITRRLERNKGSSYTINSKTVLARDVQLIFADLNISARSHSIISQGQVARLITAKPEDRYGVLMDAAGTRGLQQRRGEASRRLNATLANLTRVDDVLAAMDQQKHTLAKQVRQASRYRSIADRIRKAEAQLFSVRYRQEQASLAQAKTSERELTREVASATESASAAGRKKDETQAKLPPLREADAKASAKQQRLVLEMESIDRDEASIKTQQQDAAARLTQIDADIAHETQQKQDATVTITRLDSDLATITQQATTHTARLTSAEAALAEARSHAQKADAALADLTAQLQSRQLREEALTAQHTDLTARQKTLAAEIAACDIDKLQANSTAAKTARAQAERAAQAAHKASQAAAESANSRRSESQTAHQAANQAEHNAHRIETEIDTLTALLAGDATGDTASDTNGDANGDSNGKKTAQRLTLASHLTIPEEYELAVAAVLEDALSAIPSAIPSAGAMDTPSPDGSVLWREDLPPLSPPLTPPKNSTPLLQHITAPPMLQRALAGVGLVADSGSAARQQKDLLAGQMLTTKQGGVWRWDGLVRLPSDKATPTSATGRLRYGRRLQELQSQIRQAKSAANQARTRADTAARLLTEAEAQLATARQSETQAQAELLTATRHAEQSQAATASQTASLASLNLTAKQTAATLKKIAADQAALPSRDKLIADQAKCQKTADAARANLTTAITSHATINKEQELQHNTHREKTAELAQWQTRATTAQTRLAEFTARKEETSQTLAMLATRPQALQKQRDALATALAQAKTDRQKTTDALSLAETALAEAEVTVRQAEATLRERRETLIAQQGASQTAETILARTTQEIAEKLNIPASHVPQLLGGKTGDDGVGDTSDDSDTLKKRTERLYRERDALGAVNLMAEAEMAKLNAEIANLTSEQTDLHAAIAKLREGISRINREGRLRLRRSFADVNRHFATVFQHLFAGGKAELVLTDSDDPLVAGLEIIATPPGKRPQSLALLSGGEQALTALALVFSVFLTNPAPICILDEVDAALDDTNVARFCHLLTELTQTTPTRFVIITHHRMTMAHMDRLYGVVMQQAGVSQIVSVDLREAEQYGGQGDKA